MITTSRAVFHSSEKEGVEAFEGLISWSFFFPTYLTGYIQYVQYLSTSPNSNQSNLSSVTLPGCNLQSPPTFPIHSSFSPLKIKNFYGPVTAHILRMGGKCGERKKNKKQKTLHSEVAERSTISMDNVN